jgi:FKBP-type peptidyl-prolyl cis-trans isomerase
MSTRFRGMAGLPVSLLPAGLIGLVFVGCDAPPNMMPIAPPGAPVQRKSPDEEPAQAQGEMPAPGLQTKAEPTKVVEYTPAPPTAKGEKKTTPGGIQYETLTPGTGAELKPGQTGQFIYVGKLADGGKVFDDRTKRLDRPELLTLSESTKGWRGALPGMHVGELRKVIVPPDQGYGAKGRPPEIPPNATLVYEVELIKIFD